MLLTKLKIEKLFDDYNFEVKFNPDITLLYGMNGCGKTTILNIITAIITGEMYKLYAYRFSRIELNYKSDGADKEETINICYADNEIEVEFQKQKFIVCHLERLEVPHSRREEILNYFEENPISLQIKQTFNYVYLSLNRTNSVFDDRRYYYRSLQRNSIRNNSINEPENIDPGVSYVEDLVYQKHGEMLMALNKVNEEFRNTVLKSALDVKQTKDFYNTKIVNKNIDRIKDAYVNLLKTWNLISAKEEDQYNQWFEKYIELQTNPEKAPYTEKIDFVAMTFELEKIKKIIEIANNAESKKSSILHPLNEFLGTVNDFISSNEFKKEIIIENGRIGFVMPNNPRKNSIQYLSSGERQVVIFFANLIFGVDDNSTGIFVVDEPELSLHLAWQRRFLEKAMAVEKKVQFIFATHSPEIVGKYQNKTVRVVGEVENRQNG